MSRQLVHGCCTNPGIIFARWKCTLNMNRCKIHLLIAIFTYKTVKCGDFSLKEGRCNDGKFGRIQEYINCLYQACT